MTQLGEYIAAILLDKARVEPDEAYGGSSQAILQQLYQEVGGNVELQDVNEALNILQNFASADADYSPLTGGFWTIEYDNFKYYFIETEPEPEDDEAIYAETSGKTKDYPILQAYARRGSRYAADAARHLKNIAIGEWDNLRQEEDSANSSVPASNRVVTLDHNQRDQLEAASSEAIAAVEKENSINGDSALRQRIVGQLKAARELIRAETLSAYLLYATVVNLLKGLIDKYKGQAIGHAAKKLLDLLIEHIFGK